MVRDISWLDWNPVSKSRRPRLKRVDQVIDAVQAPSVRVTERPAPVTITLPSWAGVEGVLSSALCQPQPPCFGAPKPSRFKRAALDAYLADRTPEKLIAAWGEQWEFAKWLVKNWLRKPSKADFERFRDELLAVAGSAIRRLIPKLRSDGNPHSYLRTALERELAKCVTYHVQGTSHKSARNRHRIEVAIQRAREENPDASPDEIAAIVGRRTGKRIRGAQVERFIIHGTLNEATRTVQPAELKDLEGNTLSHWQCLDHLDQRGTKEWRESARDLWRPDRLSETEALAAIQRLCDETDGQIVDLRLKLYPGERANVRAFARVDRAIADELGMAEDTVKARLKKLEKLSRFVPGLW